MSNIHVHVLEPEFRVRGAYLKAELPSIDRLNDGEIVYAKDTQEIYVVSNGELVLLGGMFDMNLEIPPEVEVEHRCSYCGTKYFGHETHCKSCGAPL